MKTTFLFSGQGAQYVGMGAELASSDDYRALLETADRALGLPLSHIMANGPEASLTRTAVTQPAILTLSVAHARHLLTLGLRPDVLAGHSIGQYSALVIANALGLEDAVRLVAARGRMMQETVPEGAGAMIAIVGLDRETVYAACDAARVAGVVNVALHNAPGQTVISGERTAVEDAATRCEDEGGGAVPLAVSAPFHCALLEPMVPEFAKLIQATEFRNPGLPVVDNVTAQPIADAASVRRSLVEQITAPVLFEESIRWMLGAGVTRFVQCGPGKNLLGFVQRMSSQVELLTFEQAAKSPALVG